MTKLEALSLAYGKAMVAWTLADANAVDQETRAQANKLFTEMIGAHNDLNNEAKNVAFGE